MSLSANTANVTILVDDDRHTIAKIWTFQETAGDESSVLKVNASTLVARTLILTTPNTATPSFDFMPGEIVTGNTSGATGYIVESTPLSQTVIIGILTGTFSNTEIITGAESNCSITLNTITVPAYVLSIDQVWFDIPDSVVVGLEFDNNGTPTTVLPLTDQGIYGRAEFWNGLKINNLFNPSNGNLYVSTYGLGAKQAYSVVVELHKDKGFAQRPMGYMQ